MQQMARWRAVTLVVISVAAGCGGSSGTASAPPKLPHALGVQLAEQAAAVETSLRAGDSCAAVTEAATLENSVSQAIAAGQVPAALRKPLSSSTTDLTARVRCVQTPPPKPHPPHPHKPHKHHGHGPGPGDGGPGPGDGGGG